jgi:predicted nucleotidyltransferase component of viral defense system
LTRHAQCSKRRSNPTRIDIWVVWSLHQLFTGPYAEHLVFKGGTSLSKTYGVIRRFSKDVDLTYDIRAIAGDLVGDSDVRLPATKSQEKKWSKEIRTRLSDQLIQVFRGELRRLPHSRLLSLLRLLP